MINRFNSRLGFIMLIVLVYSSQAKASLDLLAGVEAGISYSSAAMNTDDLETTQQILATQQLGPHPSWKSKTNNTIYEINIRKKTFYGHYPCLIYRLNIKKDVKDNMFMQNYSMTLHACRNTSNRWISIQKIQ